VRVCVGFRVRVWVFVTYPSEAITGSHINLKLIGHIKCGYFSATSVVCAYIRFDYSVRDSFLFFFTLSLSDTTCFSVSCQCDCRTISRNKIRHMT